ncbi:hypothetical protein C8R47DRAFT_1125563 [Mycena vitilis]|nr:hypothetical protein C8R47DRAFT_1125563 [Mycena vitilis]
MHLSSVSEKIDVQTKSPLSKKLDKLSAVLSTSFPLCNATRTFINIDGEDAGTFAEPNVELFLSKSKPSPFGKGEETVLDPTYRNGREIVAADIELGNFSEKSISTKIRRALFPGESRKVSLKLYKLAIYEKGGHFDWHRDTTHSDDHHATVLIALNTSWTGGDLKLRREDVIVSPDMHPEIGKGYNGAMVCYSLQVVTFYTDIEHMVEPVTEGVRIILQFDVHVEKAKDGEAGEDEEEEDDEDAYEGNIATEAHCLKPDIPTSIPLSTAANDAIMLDIIGAIENLHADGVHEVGFPLQHLYRKASVLPAYLKCTDSRLYEALRQKFCVSLHPVLLEESSDYEGSFNGEDSTIKAHKFDLPESDFDAKSGDESDNDDGSDDRSNSGRPKKRVKLQKVFHLTKCPLVQICSTSYSEYTGNEAQPAENKYFGAGFFVTAKEEDKKEDTKEA